MTLHDFFAKIGSRYLWGNLFAMILLSILLVWGVLFAISTYTHHGESVSVPNLRGLQFEEAQQKLQLRGLIIQVNDSGFVRAAPANSVLEQSIEAGTKVKKGRTIYITINSTNTPTLVVPDVADNCSMREAQTKLKAIGFNLDEVEYINGEKDWVYEIKHNGTILSAGSRVPVDARITLVVGNGMVETEEEDSTAVNDYPIDAGLTDEEKTIGNE